MWNKRPTFMHNTRYTANQWEDIHAWINTALTAEREHAIQRLHAFLNDENGSGVYNDNDLYTVVRGDK